MTSEAVNDKIDNMIGQMQAVAGGTEVGILSEESRQRLLQAAREMQYNLETAKETCLRYRYSPLDLTITHIFHKLKLFDILVKHKDSPISTDQLAKETQTDPLLLGPYLPYVTALPLAPDLARFLSETGYRNPIESTKTVHQLTHKTDLHGFDWMIANPKYYEILDRFMASNRLAKTGVDIFPFQDKVPCLVTGKGLDPTTPLFVDVGGGRGQMCRVFRNKFPETPGRVVFQDLPNTISSAEPVAGIEGMAYDFFEPQPIKGSKVYYLRHVLHDWPDVKAELILKNIIDAADQDSIIVIDEKIVQNVGASRVATGLDLQMMMSYAAQERTEKQWKSLLGSVGLKIQEMWYYEENAADGVMLVLPK
ncbi:MAG: hypothetical protein Q9170_000397 [Blastenia crenularia]